MQQEQLDSKMLDTGTVPVNDKVDRMPAPARGEREYLSSLLRRDFLFAASRTICVTSSD